ncbi:uncharacterized protein ISCGN_008313 [Ixodes scapularis]
MTANVDTRGIGRGFCSECSCKEFYRDPVHCGTHHAEWCAYCGHPLTANSLKVEAGLRFQSTMVIMLGKLEEVKRAFCGDDPTTFLNIEDHLRSRLARSSLIPTDKRTPDERVPGPKIFFGSEKQIVQKQQNF